LSLLQRRRLDEELADELSAHLEYAAADNIARGMSRSEAQRAAARRFGGVLQTTEAYRHARGLPFVESLWLDATYAVRSLLRQPAFSAVALVVLAAVIGLNTSLFTLTAGLLFRPWSGLNSPGRVVTIVPVDAVGRSGGFSIVASRFIADRAKSLSAVSVMRPESVDLGRQGAKGRVGAFLVSGNLFDVLGVRMARGRGFAPDEDRAGAPRAVAVLGYALWQARFAGSPDVIGTAIDINDVPFTIVGIAPEAFVGPEPDSANVFLPVASVSLLRPQDPAVASFLYRADDCCSDLVGRLAPRATRQQAAAELDVLTRSFQAENVAGPRQTRDEGWHVVVGGTEFLARPGRKNQLLVLIALLSAGLALVWLLACANIGNLQIARAAARAREIGTRLSLGASRARVVRQLLIEGLILALGATVLGIGIAFIVPKLLVTSLAQGPPPFSLEPDAIVLIYAVMLAGASAVAFGLAPALHATHTDITNALRSAPADLNRSGFRLRSVLLGAQIALSVILLVSAGLLVRGAQRRASFDPGFSTDVTVVSFQTPAADSRTGADALVAHLVGALGDSQGRFAFAAHEPLAMSRDLTAVQAPGATTRSQPADVLAISPDYFDVLRIQVVAGRRFLRQESAAAIMINESLARVHWPNENAVGKTLLIGGPQGLEPRQVVGVVRDVYTANLTRIAPTVYRMTDHWLRAPVLLLKAGNAPVAAVVARTVAQFDSRVSVQITPLADRLEEQLRPFRYGAVVATTLGLSALALATIGTFGVFMYSVRQRTREIGVRIALGAAPSAVVRLILTSQSHAILGGLALGVVGAVGAAAVLRGLVYGISPIDPIAYAGVIAILTVAGLAASYIPVRHAARIEPASALRYE